MILWALSFIGLSSVVFVQINCKKKKKEVEQPAVVTPISPVVTQSTDAKSTFSNDIVQMDITQREDESELVLEMLEMEEQKKQKKSENKVDSKTKSDEKSGKREKSEKSEKKIPLEIDKTQPMSEKEDGEKAVEKPQTLSKNIEKVNQVSSMKFYGESPQKIIVKGSQDNL